MLPMIRSWSMSLRYWAKLVGLWPEPSEPDALVRVRIVQGCLGINGAPIPVEGRAGGVRIRGGIAQHVVWELVGPVVVPDQDLGRDPGRCERGADVTPEQSGLLARAHAHPGVARWNVERLVLHGDEVDRQPLGRVCLNELDAGEPASD